MYVVISSKETRNSRYVIKFIFQQNQMVISLVEPDPSRLHNGSGSARLNGDAIIMASIILNALPYMAKYWRGKISANA